jgi:hypothetical protein
MHTSYRVARSLLAAFSIFAAYGGHAQQIFTSKTIVQWAQGGDRERAMLTQMGVAELAQGQFGLSVADLNADGRPEILVLSMGACDNAGCPVTAIQNAGAGKVNRIFSQHLGGRLAITNEVVGGYNALAAADQAGSIMKDASGKQLVYPVGGAQSAAAPQAAPATAARPAAPATAAPATAPPVPTARPTAPTQPAGISPQRRAFLTGSDKPDWRTPGAEYLPSCMLPRCLSPRVLEKGGVGTEKATARAEVTLEDATRWCAAYRELDRTCPEGEVGLGGSDGMIGGRDKVRTVEANCVAGTISWPNGGSARYAGLWDDGPGKGRARFERVTTWEQQGLTQLDNGSSSLNELARDRASGEELAVIWEVLCGDAKPAR